MFRTLLLLLACSGALRDGRAAEGTWGGKAPPPERYVDLRYYEAALRRIAR